MPTKIDFVLPSKPNCKPLLCDVGEGVYASLKSECYHKSADGSEAMFGLITSVVQLTAMSWRYTVEFQDNQIIYGQSITAADFTGRVSCISGTDKALHLKNQSWQTFELKAPGVGISAGNYPLLRRQRPFFINAIEVAIGAFEDTPTITVQLQKSGANNTTFANVGSLLTMPASPVLTGRRTFIPRLEVGSSEALRAVVTISGTYPAATGLQLHLFTSEAI